MNGVFAIALSGLATQSKRLAVSAANVANMGSLGVRSDPPAPDDEGYVPQRVVAVAGAQGGVRSRSQPISPPSVLVQDPGDPAADAQGLVPRPNVSLEREVVTQIEAKRAYQANLKVLQTLDDMMGSLLDVKS